MQPLRANILKHLLLWLGAALVMAVAIIVGMKQPTHRPLSYVRYVSPARSDGTRCTFLYPATLGQPIVSATAGIGIATGKTNQIQSIQVFSRISTGEAFIQRFSILRREIPINSAEISITSVDDPAQKDPFPTRPIKSENPRYIKSENASIGEGGGEHDLVVKDKRSNVKYNFEYICWLPGAGSSSAGDFVRADAVVSQSFQVLPPGAALPADAPKQPQ